MLSEFLLGHLLSLSFGSVFKQYALTMGIFVLSMGLGSWKFGGTTDAGRVLKKVLLLSAIFLSLAFFTIRLSIMNPQFHWLLLPQLILIGAVGFFSGAELPLLAKLSSPERKENNIAQVLIWDYLGMAFGSLFFGFYILQTWGVYITFALLLGSHALLLTWAFLRAPPQDANI